VFQNFDRACNGEEIARGGVMAALNILQRSAKADAEPEAEDDMEA